jgi:hypothetical protein
MKKYQVTFALIGLLLEVSAQQNYWQQEVNYTIQVQLDDQKHELHAFESFVYVNNSPNTLDLIYIHLWPNAYRNGKTALANQIYEQNKVNILHFGKPEDKGGIDSLDFKINGTTIKWEYHKKHQDIAVLYLNQPLKTGQKITVSTPFKIKIPSGDISRLGHVDQSYQITQWYPKPAVYDHKGWHPMPYLSQGEFYSEYGSFDVTIKLPSNYVVGATGDLQSPAEVAFLDSLSKISPLDQEAKVDLKGGFKKMKTEFPKSSTTFKTIRYTQSNVHDFAWFADKRYRVRKGEVELPYSKRKVTTWAMYVPQNERLWSKSLEYLHDATYYYSLWNGEYPYNQVTAVDGTISAGGGMEYPNVTVIGNTNSATELELVIVHEVGHNWFYGILGSNEREHGWMDEGLNTLNEMRYFMTKYPDNTGMNEMIPFIDKIHFEELSHHDMGDIMFRATQRFGADQPIETHSCKFHPANYGTVMYQKTGLVFHYLKAYLGEQKFDECMSAYYNRWKFKHPYPEDLRTVFEEITKKDLSWCFGDLINTTSFVDYKLIRSKTDKNGSKAIVKNTGQVNGPIEINVLKNGKIVETQWIEPGKGRRKVDLITTEADEIAINHNKHIPELYRNNNRWHEKGILGKLEPVKMEFLIGDNESNRNNVFWTPVIAGNTADKLMLGAAIHNNALPMNRFQYLVAPMYSFGGKRVSGIAEFSYVALPKTVFRISRFGLSVKSFNDNVSTLTNQQTPFLAFTPYWNADLGRKGDKTPWSQNVLVQGVYNTNLNNGLRFAHSGAFAQYKLDYETRDFQMKAKLRVDYMESNFNFGFIVDEVRASRLQLEHTTKYRYLKNKMSRFVELRLFGGTFLIDNASYTMGGVTITDPRMALSINGSNGSQDLFFENYYFGRSETSGVFGAQREDNMGAFKSGGTILTNRWMTTANMYAQLPIKRLGFLGVFADLGAVGGDSGTEFVGNIGLGMRLGEVFGVYFPIYSTDNIIQSTGSNAYAERIRFTLKMNLVNQLNFRKLIN